MKINGKNRPFIFIYKQTLFCSVKQNLFLKFNSLFMVACFFLTVNVSNSSEIYQISEIYPKYIPYISQIYLKYSILYLSHICPYASLISGLYFHVLAESIGIMAINVLLLSMVNQI